MNEDIQLKKYNKTMEHSYSFGSFPTIELLKNQPKSVVKILIHSDMTSPAQAELINDICNQHKIPIEYNNRIIEKLRDKENCLVIGVFKKYKSKLNENENHIVLVNPGDMGNMGTIIRSCVGFGIQNLAIIEPGVDVFHPKVVRASMGSLFQLNFTYFPSFEEYQRKFTKGSMYPFMLKGATDLSKLEINKKERFSLIFGNEATGLDDSFLEAGVSVFINHTNNIDSLNLSLAVGIGVYEFTKK